MQLSQGEPSSAAAAPSGGASAAPQAPLREPQFGNDATSFGGGSSQNTLDEPLWVIYTTHNTVMICRLHNFGSFQMLRLRSQMFVTSVVTHEVSWSLFLCPTKMRPGEPQDTIARDLKQVYLNLKLVVFPFGSDREQQAQALRNWDLWGPMVLPLCTSCHAFVRLGWVNFLRVR